MAIDRTAAAAYLSSLFVSFSAEIGQASEGATSTGYGGDIDNALRDLDVTEANLATATVAETQRRLFFTLLEYYAARRMWIRYGARGSERLGPRATDWKGSQEAIKAIMDDAAARAAAGGVTVDSASSWTLSRLNMDFLEPEESADA